MAQWQVVHRTLPPPKRPRVEARGGRNQKARWEAEEQALANPPQKSQLADYLLDRWCWGYLSTPVLQQIAAAAVADGASHPDVVFLSKLGSSGKYPNNMYRELTQRLKPAPLDEAVDKFIVWQKNE